MLIEIKDDSFDKQVANNSMPFVVAFFSPLCGLCQKIIPKIEELSGRCHNVEFGKIDITTNKKIPSKFKIFSLPTIIIFKNGKEIKRTSGDLSIPGLEKQIEALV